MMNKPQSPFGHTSNDLLFSLKEANLEKTLIGRRNDGPYSEKNGDEESVSPDELFPRHESHVPMLIEKTQLAKFIAKDELPVGGAASGDTNTSAIGEMYVSD